ncbi:hypothetical protein LOCC1_G005830, partial [Lachnellula occidentalis]
FGYLQKKLILPFALESSHKELNTSSLLGSTSTCSPRGTKLQIGSMAKKKKNNSAGGSGSAPAQDLNHTSLALTHGPKKPKKPRRDIVEEFDRYFGSEDNLDNWQRLCHDVGVEDDLTSITKCKKELKDVWINIYDLLDAVKKGKQPRRFPSQRALAHYTIKFRKIYPKKQAKEEGAVRALLAHIFDRNSSGRHGQS